jgi:hypothetical protein
MLKAKSKTLFLLLFSSLTHSISHARPMSEDINYIVLDGKNDDQPLESATKLFQEASAIFADSFAEAYKEISLTTLGWPDNGHGEEDSKKAVLREVVQEDVELYTKIISEKEPNNKCDYIFIFALIQDKVVGYRSMEQCSYGIVYSRQGAVHPLFQRKGISTGMLRQHHVAWPHTKVIYTCSRILNPKGPLFWHAIGFVDCSMDEVNAAANTAYSDKKYRGFKWIAKDDEL